MENDADLEKMVKELMNAVDSKIMLTEFTIIVMCGVLMDKTKNNPELWPTAKKKIIEELSKLSCYQWYMNKLKTEN